MLVESRPTISKPEGIKASRHEDQIIHQFPCTLACLLPPFHPEHRLIVHESNHIISIQFS